MGLSIKPLISRQIGLLGFPIQAWTFLINMSQLLLIRGETVQIGEVGIKTSPSIGILIYLKGKEPLLI